MRTDRQIFSNVLHCICFVQSHLQMYRMQLMGKLLISGSIRVTGSLSLFITMNRNEWLRATYLCFYRETVLQVVTVFHNHTVHMSRIAYSSWWLSSISHYWLNNISQCTVKDFKLRWSCRSEHAVMLIGCIVYTYRLHSVETWLHWPQTASCYHTDCSDYAGEFAGILLADSSCRPFIADLCLVQV